MLKVLFSLNVLNNIFERSKRLWSVVVVREAGDAHIANTKMKNIRKTVNQPQI